LMSLLYQDFGVEGNNFGRIFFWIFFIFILT
jgi:hypothetical protein